MSRSELTFSGDSTNRCDSTSSKNPSREKSYYCSDTECKKECIPSFIVNCDKHCYIFCGIKCYSKYCKAKKNMQLTK